MAGIAALVVGCASGGPPVPGASPAISVPGFDLRDFPGEAAMRTWRSASPYRWVGFYLPAPCYTGSSWMGRRALLEDMGWGVAVLFVGEQDWAAMSGPATMGAVPDTAAAEPRCTRTNLGPERGRIDGTAAAAAARTEGFPPGTAIYLDVERVDRVSPELAAYVTAWFDQVLDDGDYEPALYAHTRNVSALRLVASEVFRRAGLDGEPRLWVAGPGDFDLEAPPTRSGVDGAEIWQGRFDVDETWGGVTLRIDANVARSSSPSR